MIKVKNILEFDNKQAQEFFLRHENYAQFVLPEYFNFEHILQVASSLIGRKKIESMFEKTSTGILRPSDCEDVNFRFLHNKDGRFAWRPFQLIHPVIYVSLVKEITEAKNWELILNRLKEFAKLRRIKCMSLPVISESKLTNKAAQINTWWLEVEQESIKLSLKYKYLLHTDISDCYGSLYTHSIPWALHGRKCAKINRNDNSLLGNLIDTHLRYMSNGQTNGIPQGSILMDFCAEILLGFIDQTLHERIRGVRAYRIIRYRDDYRIFTNRVQDSEEIVKSLSEVLSEVGMRLNTQKTLISDNVLRDSIKPDKIERILMKGNFKNLQKRLLSIHNLSLQFPNSGSLDTELSYFLNHLTKSKVKKAEIEVLIAIVVDIAYRNSRTYPISAAILSTLISKIQGNVVKRRLIIAIKKKFEQLPNTSYLLLWLQRISVTVDKVILFEDSLCKKVTDPKEVIWNSEWLNLKDKTVLEHSNIVDYGLIDTLNTSIDPKRVQVFPPIS